MRRVPLDVSDRGEKVPRLGDHRNTILILQLPTQAAPRLALVVREHDLDV
jgi:hypothetical protein